MATGETGFDDVTVDLVPVRYHALEAGHDDGRHVRDAENAGRSDVADAQRAHRCHGFLARPSAAQPAGR